MDNSPTLASMVRNAMDARLDRVFVAELGVVKSYDSSKRVAVVQLLAANRYLDEGGDVQAETIAVLPSVPVVRVGGGPFRLSMPVAAGDECLVIFCDNAVSTWQAYVGGPYDPGALGHAHHLDGAIAIVGLAPWQTRDPELTDDAAAVLGSATGPKVRVSETAVELGIPAASEPVLTVTDATAIFAALADPAVCAAIAATAVSGDPSGVVAALTPHVTATAGSSVVKASR